MVVSVSCDCGCVHASGGVCFVFALGAVIEMKQCSTLVPLLLLLLPSLLLALAISFDASGGGVDSLNGSLHASILQRKSEEEEEEERGGEEEEEEGGGGGNEEGGGGNEEELAENSNM